MTLGHAGPTNRTYLVECFGEAIVPDDAGRSDGGDGAVLATLAIADDEQLLVLVRGADEAAAEESCVAAGLTVDRVVEVTLSPAWRWGPADPGSRRRAPAPHR